MKCSIKNAILDSFPVIPKTSSITLSASSQFDENWSKTRFFILDALYVGYFSESTITALLATLINSEMIAAWEFKRLHIVSIDSFIEKYEHSTSNEAISIMIFWSSGIM